VLRVTRIVIPIVFVFVMSTFGTVHIYCLTIIVWREPADAEIDNIIHYAARRSLSSVEAKIDVALTRIEAECTRKGFA